MCWGEGGEARFSGIAVGGDGEFFFILRPLTVYETACVCGTQEKYHRWTTADTPEAAVAAAARNDTNNNSNGGG